MNTKLQFMYTLAVIAGVIILGVFAFFYLSFKQQEVQNEARFQCAQSSVYQVTNGKTVVSYPVSDLYTACLREKGL